MLLVLNEGIAEIKCLWMATKQFHDTVTGSDVLRKRVKTVGAAMRNACEPYTVLHLGTARRQASWERSERYGIYLATDELRYDLTVDEQARNTNFAILNLIRYWTGSQRSCYSSAFEPRRSFESTTQRTRVLNTLKIMRPCNEHFPVDISSVEKDVYRIDKQDSSWLITRDGNYIARCA